MPFNLSSKKVKLKDLAPMKCFEYNIWHYVCKIRTSKHVFAMIGAATCLNNVIFYVNVSPMSRLLNIANIERGGYRLHDIFAKASYDIY